MRSDPFLMSGLGLRGPGISYPWENAWREAGGIRTVGPMRLRASRHKGPAPLTRAPGLSRKGRRGGLCYPHGSKRA